MRGLDGSMVHEKRARRFYGVISGSNEYSHDIDDDLRGHIYWNEWLDQNYVEGCMRWFLKRVRIINSSIRHLRTAPQFLMPSLLG